MHEQPLEHIDESTLLNRFGALVAHDRRTTAKLLVYIDEIDRRKLWANQGFSSMFSFCIERYRMSESIAAKRIRAARAARKFPVIFEMIASGMLHLSAVSLIAKHLTDENHRELLKRATHQTIRDVERLIAEIAPKPDVAARIISLPARVSERAKSTSESTGLEQPLLSCARQGASAPSAQPRLEPPRQPQCLPAASVHDPRTRAPEVKPLSVGRYKLQVTIGQETHDKLRRLQALLSHSVPDGDPAEILDRALDALLEQTLKKKAAATNKPRERKRVIAPESRTIPAEVKRAVWERDGGRCAFVSAQGRRCNETRLVEFHHREPFARGGSASIENISLRCAPHNQVHAERDYGAAFMNRKRPSPQIREQAAVYIVEWRLPTVVRSLPYGAKREVLRQLSNDELLGIVKRFELEVRGRRVNEELVDAIAAPKRATLSLLAPGSS